MNLVRSIVGIPYHLFGAARPAPAAEPLLSEKVRQILAAPPMVVSYSTTTRTFPLDQYIMSGTACLASRS
jgi:hypothetical protein